MPIYEYACRECEIAFDAFQKMSDKPLKTCPMCEKDILVKLFSIPHIKVESDPKTIGELAERNTRRMSKDELAEKSELKRDKRKQGMKEIANKAGGKAIEQPDSIPWWRDGKSFGCKYSDKPIDTSKISNLRKYVETGQS